MTHDPLCDDFRIGARRDKTRPCICGYIARVREDERAAALRDAVEAVRLSCSADIELVERSEVIAAIEPP